MHLEQTFDQALSAAGEAIRKGQLDEAANTATALAASYPDAVRVWELLAKVHEARGDLPAAIEARERVLSVMPDHQPSLISIAQDLAALGRASEARWFAQQALDYTPDHEALQRIVGESDPLQIDEGRGLYRLALARLRLGMPRRALTYLWDAVGLCPDRVDVRLTLASVLLQSGRRVAAADACLDVLNQNPDCLLAHALLIVIWRAAGAQFLERHHLTALERLDPDHRVTHELLAERSPLSVVDVPAQRLPTALPPASAWPDDWTIDMPAPETSTAETTTLPEGGSAADFIAYEWSPIVTEEADTSDVDLQPAAEIWMLSQFVPTRAEEPMVSDGDVAPAIEPMTWVPAVEEDEAARASNEEDDQLLKRYLGLLRKARGKALQALIAELEQIVAQRSADARWYELLGMAYARRGDSLSAIRAFQRAMELDSE